MQTPSDSFKIAAQMRSSERRLMVVVQVGAAIYGFLEQPDIETGIQYYPVLLSVSSISNGIDPMTRRQKMGKATITLSNAPFTLHGTGRGGVAGRISDILPLEDFLYAKAFVYYLVGPKDDTYIDTSGNALLAFSGKIQVEPSYNEKEVKFTIHNFGKFVDKKMPSTLIADVYTAPPIEQRNRFIPLVYGKWYPESPNITDKPGVGLAVAERTSSIIEAKFVVSDHQLNALTEFTLVHNALGGNLTLLTQTDFDTNDSGRGVATLHRWFRSQNGVYLCSTKIYPVDSEARDYSIDFPSTNVVDFSNAIDRDPLTYASLLDYIDTGSYRSCRALFAFPDFDVGDVNTNLIGELRAATSDSVNILGQADNNDPWDEASANIYYDIDTGTDQYVVMSADTTTLLFDTTKTFFIAFLGTEADPPKMRTTIAWHMRGGKSDAIADPPQPVVIYLKWQKTAGDGDADTVIGNSTPIKIFDISLTRLHLARDVVGPTYVACEGLVYDSWITGRISTYIDGDLIVDPAGIIESLLRDVYGLSSSNIDQPSFINAENTSVQARLNLHTDNRMLLTAAIRQIAEQSTFMFLWTRIGKARLVDLTAAPGSVDETISWYDLTGAPRLHTHDFLVNELNVKHRYRPELIGNEWRSFDTYSDATSQTAHGTWSMDVEWPNITNIGAPTTTIDEVAQLLVNSTNGLWSKRHRVITIETRGFRYAHMEVGDWISLDTDADDHFLFDGASWSGLKFLIIDIKQTLDTTTMQAIKLF